MICLKSILVYFKNIKKMIKTLKFDQIIQNSKILIFIFDDNFLTKI